MKRLLLDQNNKKISIRRQCVLLGLNRSTAYYELKQETQENLDLMREIDCQYTKTPFYGSRRMLVHLQNLKWNVNRKRIQRLMHLMGIEAIYTKPKTSISNPEHRIYPYLLRGLKITHSNQVWSTDITFIPMENGFMYLVAVIDWFSRYVLSWNISNTLHSFFCEEALEKALEKAQPEIFNTDQGSQFTAESFTQRLLSRGILVSMDGRGRALDNVFIERLWRSLKYEDIYLKSYMTGSDLFHGVARYFEFYNKNRPHQSLDYRTPEAVYTKKAD